jgi:iron complex transport system substrate-binding protein
MTYVKLIFFGERPETELADAKYDGEINPLDFVQIKLIIVGKENELTIIDDPPFGKAKTIKMPVARVVAGPSYTPEAIRGIDATDKLVGIALTTAKYDALYPEISKLPTVGKYTEPDIETMLDLKADIFLTYGKSPGIDYEDKIEDVGIRVIRLSFYGDTELQDIIKLGYILDKREGAEEYSGYINGYMETVKSRTEGLSEDEKPKVFLGQLYQGQYYASGAGSTRDAMCSMSGGINIAADLPSSSVVDPEWLVEQNPEFIIVRGRGSLDDLKAARDEITNRTELAEVDAVKNGRVYVTRTSIEYVRSFIGIMHKAKLFHPDLFDDLDPQAIHEVYLDRFQGIPITYEEEGVFFYP